ncbi:MAG: TIGR00282 family metallophosphoesterase [Candidatus Uhrbacteria bacterium]
MKIIIFGDTIGKIGREAIKKILPEFKTEFQPDLIVMNAENLAHGFGITKKIILELQEVGIDVFTSGNHIWNNEKYDEVFNDQDLKNLVLRPFNDIRTEGIGFTTIEKNGFKIFIGSLSGMAFMEKSAATNFILAADELMAKANESGAKISLIDFHAEATSEKAVLGRYLDGRVSAVVGTHTHVPTADERILPKGTAFISDIGMTGSHNQAIGGAYGPIVEGMKIGTLGKFEVPESGPIEINAVIIEIDEKTGHATKIERIRRILI